MLFQAVGSALQQHRQALNQADPHNGNHGDHMVEIFSLAAQAAMEKRGDRLSEAMIFAGQRLAGLKDNGSAQVYARGLAQFAAQFNQYNIEYDDFARYVQRVLSGERHGEGQDAVRSGDILKALVAGLASWGQIGKNHTDEDRPISMGTLFEFGMAYLQAKQRSGSRAEILADAAVSVTPLSNIPHRFQSGRIVLESLLIAIGGE